MPEYRRHLVAGATYFFTVNLLGRRSHLLVERIELLRQVVARVRMLMPFHVDAWVVLPDHMHGLWTLPHDDGPPRTTPCRSASCHLTEIPMMMTTSPWVLAI